MTSRALPVIALSFGALFVMKASNIAAAASKKTEPAAIEQSDNKNPNSLQGEAKASNSSGQPVALPEQTDVCLTPAIAETLKRDRTTLNERLLDLEARKKALIALEAKLDEKIKTVEIAKAGLQDQADALTRVAVDDLAHLVTMYGTMKPKKAAEIFDNMDPAFAAGFIRELDGVKAGMILAEMDTDNSYKISVLIANRNASWRQASNKN